jgi:hypothetical protein
MKSRAKPATFIHTAFKRSGRHGGLILSKIPPPPPGNPERFGATSGESVTMRFDDRFFGGFRL